MIFAQPCRFAFALLWVWVYVNDREARGLVETLRSKEKELREELKVAAR